MDKRIEIEKADNSLVIIIKAFKDEAKQKILLMWIVLFSICGLTIFSQFFGDYDNGTKVFFGVYVAFWFFFEFKVIYAYRWRSSGLEKIIIEDEQLILIKEIGKRGVTQYFNLKEIKTLRLFKDDDTGFIKSMSTSYWNINKYTIAFNYDERPILFAIDLSKKESNNILKEINKFL